MSRVDDGLDRLSEAERRLQAMVDMTDRMIAALNAVSERLDRIDKRIDKALPRWQRGEYKIDGTPRGNAYYSQAIKSD